LSACLCKALAWAQWALASPARRCFSPGGSFCPRPSPHKRALGGQRHPGRARRAAEPRAGLLELAAQPSEHIAGPLELAALLGGDPLGRLLRPLPCCAATPRTQAARAGGRAQARARAADLQRERDAAVQQREGLERERDAAGAERKWSSLRQPVLPRYNSSL